MNRLIEEDIKNACEVLSRGGVILYPTDTIWGVGCDATCPEAVARIYGIKKRSDSKSLLVLLDSADKLDLYVNNLLFPVQSLIDRFNKPLTVIYPGAKNVAPNLIAEDGSLGVRITNEAFSRELCRRFNKPLVSTSANISGQPAPENFAKINGEIIRSVDYTVNYRRNDSRPARPSAIIKVEQGKPIQIIRK
jgi:L-threonylcarbamoyladenylate synthase